MESLLKRHYGGLLLGAAVSVLLIISPFLSFFAKNMSEPSFGIQEFLNFSLILIGVIFLYSLAFGMMLAAIKPKYFITSQIGFGVIFFLCFTHGSALNVVSSVKILPPGSFSIFFMVMLLAVYLITLLRFKPTTLVPPALIFAFVVTLVPSINIAQVYLTDLKNRGGGDVSVASRGSNEVSSVSRQKRPNVYYFILDAHPSLKTMKGRFDTDLTDFADKMEGLGFYIAGDAKAAYPRTNYALASIFAGDYLGEGRYTSSTLFPKIMSGEKEPRVISDLSNLGYEFFWFGNYYAPCNQTHSKCLQEEESFLIANPVRLFLIATPISYFEESLVKVFNVNASVGRKVDSISDVKGAILSQENSFGTEPYFVFAHHLSPHPPFQFLKDCSLRGQFKFDFKSWSAQGEPLFVDNVKCATKSVLEVASLLVEKDPSAIVVFQSDHGSAFDTPWDLPLKDWSKDIVGERFSMLNMVRLPPECRDGLRQTLNNVNAMRLVLACLAGTDPDLRPDISHFSTGVKSNPDYGKYLPFRVLETGEVEVIQ